MNSVSTSIFAKGGRERMLIVAVVLIVASLALLAWVRSSKDTTPSMGYQAVFLINGQVYFGKLSHSRSRYLQLTDVFYLQSTKNLQTGADSTNDSLSLVKLGKELHGPKDMMSINGEQVLFIEDLKDDSRVVQAINEYKKTK